MKTRRNLQNSTNLLLPNGCKVLQSKALIFNPINQLLDPDPSLHSHSLLLLIHLQDLIHESQIDHPSPGQSNPIGGQPRADGANPVLPSIGLLDYFLELLKGLGLVEDPGLDLVGPAPVRDGVELLRERGVAEDLGLLVLGVLGKWERVVGGGTAE